MPNTFERVRSILGNTLRLGKREALLERETALLGDIPEFDSMAVLAVVTALEAEFAIEFEDEEATAATFETVGSLVDAVERKLAESAPEP